DAEVCRRNRNSTPSAAPISRRNRAAFAVTSVKLSPRVSMTRSARARTFGADVAMAESEAMTRSRTSAAVAVLHVLDHVEEAPPHLLHEGEDPVELGVVRQFELDVRRHPHRRLRLGGGGQGDAAPDHFLLQRGVLALQARNVALQH